MKARVNKEEGQEAHQRRGNVKKNKEVKTLVEEAFK